MQHMGYQKKLAYHYTLCPRSPDPYYRVTFDMKWVKTSLTLSIMPYLCVELTMTKKYINWKINVLYVQEFVSIFKVGVYWAYWTNYKQVIATYLIMQYNAVLNET